MALSDYDPVINEAAQSWNLDPNLLRALILHESGDDPGATSKKGAYGLTQIIPDTARGLGITDPRNATQQIYGGAKYLSQALDAEKGDPAAALLYYHGGPGWRGAYGPESAGYVPAVAAQYAKLTKGQAAQPPATPSAAPAAIPSDDDFLNSVAPKPTAPTATQTPAVPTDEDFLKAVGASPAPQPPSQTPNDISGADRDAYGNPLHALAPDTAPGVVRDVIQPVAGVASDAAKSAIGTQPLGLDPRQQALLGQWGIYPPAEGGGTPLQYFNRALINPLVAGGDAAMRGLSAGGAALGAGLRTLGAMAPDGPSFSANSATPFGRYIDESATALMSPRQLANDLSAMPQAFAGSPNFAGMPRATEPAAPNPLQSWQPAEGPQYLSPEFRANPGNLTRTTIPDAGPSRLLPEDRIVFPDNPPSAPTTEGAPKSAGAAGTPSTVANIDPRMENAYRSVAEQQKLNEAQPVGIPDYRALVPGEEPALAHLEQSANVAREQKMLEQQIPQEFKGQAASNNDARRQYLESLVPSPVQIENMKAAREAQRVADTTAAWKAKQPTDPTPLVQQAQDILNGPQGKMNSVKGAVKQLMDGLQNPDGTFETDPERLYGVRRDLANDYSKKAVSADPTKEAGAAVLKDLLPAIDQVIEKGAPGYRQYMDNFAAASQPIDAAEALNDHVNGLYDSQGRMQLSRVQKMMKDVTEARAAPGLNGYKHIPDETMQGLWNLRDSLRRVASSDELARARGSDTAQNAMDIAKDAAGVAGNAAVGAAHAAVSHIPGANLAMSMGRSVLNSLMSARYQRQLQERASRMAHPGIPLQPPDAP